MIRSVVIVAALIVSACTEPPAPAATPAPEPVTPAAPVVSEATARADAMVEDMRRRQAAQAKFDRETPLPPPPSVLMRQSEPEPSPVTDRVSAAAVSPAYAPIELPPTRERPAFDIMSASYQITERNSVYWRFSWNTTIRNQTRDTLRAEVIVQFKNAGGFVLHEDSTVETFGISAIDDLSDYSLIRVEQARQVASVGVLVRPR